MKKLVISLAVVLLIGGAVLAVYVSQAGAREGVSRAMRPVDLGLDDSGKGYGMSGAVETGDGQQGHDPEFLGDIEPIEVWEDSRFAINSVAMRGCRMGAINLVGPPAGSVAFKAYLYWQWACLEQPVTGIHDTVKFKQVYPLKIGGNVTGTLVGVAPNPCWCSTNFSAWTYRADVTGFLSPAGGGSYGVILKGPAAGSYDYEDPWAAGLFPDCPQADPPLFEGAALVVIYHSSCEPNGTVCVYDAPLPSTMFLSTPGVTYNLIHPPTPAIVSEARWAQASCDGQTGAGYVDAPAFPTLGTTNTFINGGLVAGPGSAYNDSDLNGSAGKPLPQLYESSGHDMTHYMLGGIPMTNIAIFDPFGTGTDCIVPDVNVLFFR